MGNDVHHNVTLFHGSQEVCMPFILQMKSWWYSVVYFLLSCMKDGHMTFIEQDELYQQIVHPGFLNFFKQEDNFISMSQINIYHSDERTNMLAENRNKPQEWWALTSERVPRLRQEFYLFDGINCFISVFFTYNFERICLIQLFRLRVNIRFTICCDVLHANFFDSY